MDFDSHGGSCSSKIPSTTLFSSFLSCLKTLFSTTAFIKEYSLVSFDSGQHCFHVWLKSSCYFLCILSCTHMFLHALRRRLLVLIWPSVLALKVGFAGPAAMLVIRFILELANKGRELFSYYGHLAKCWFLLCSSISALLEKALAAVGSHVTCSALLISPCYHQSL